MGRERGPLHERGPHNRWNASEEARRAIRGPDRDRRRIPNLGMKRVSVRTWLTVVYAGLFLLTGASLLVLNYTPLDQYLPRGVSQAAISRSGLFMSQDPGGVSTLTVDPGPGGANAQTVQAVQVL